MSKKIILQVTPIWERQPGETSGQYMWFTRYKEARLEGGSMASIRQKFGKKPGYDKALRKWSAENRWVERIEAYRDFLEANKQRQRLKDIEDMGERQSRNGMLLQQYGIAWFVAHQDIGASLSPEMAVRFIEAGSRIERTARGAPTEIRVEGELPEETRKRMEALYAEAMAEDGEVSPDNIIRRSIGEEVSSGDD
jgi:hypothetical protein